MQDPGYKRRYGDEEVGLILRRAAEIQRRSPDSAAGGGLTLEELEEIAQEAGIDPGHLRRAAAELDTGVAHDQTSAAYLGGPLTIRFERTLDGELSERDFEGLISEIQVAMEHGQASLIGHTLSWRASTTQNNMRSTQVTVSSRQGKTQIRIEERLHGIAGGLFGGIMGGVGGGLGLGIGLGVGIEVLGSVAFAVAWPAGVIGLSYMLARGIFGSIARRRRRILRELLDRITEFVAQTATSPTPALERREEHRELPGT